jgi:N-acetylmuramoyl-L-alanine amidase
MVDPLMAMVAERDAINVANLTPDSVAQPVASDTVESLPVQKNEPIEVSIESPEVNGQNAEQNSVKEKAQPINDSVNKSDVKKVGRQIVVAIDAGHGGEDPGALGATGSREKDITLMVAKKLKQQIDNEPNMRGVLTRDGDYFIPLHGRVVKARKMQADLFVSIHADAFNNQSARGSSVFALSERGATSASARYLAKKENESDLIGGVSLDDKDPILARTLLDLSQTATINDSLKLGKAVLAQIGEINKLHAKRVEQAAFAVLKSPDIPSILVETAFISNPEEERRLNDEAYQEQLVASILLGIKKYFSTNPALAKSKLALE